MKKAMLILVIAILGLGLISCEKNDDLVTPQTEDVTENQSKLKSSYAYISRSRMVSYALTYSEQWTSCTHETGDARKNCTYYYNSSYINDASTMSDCANFASQALKYAYLPEDATWKYNSGSPTSAWVGVASLYNYLNSEYYTSVYSVTGITDIDYSYYLDDAEVGDLVFLLSTDNSGYSSHVMIVTGVVTGVNGAYDIKLTGHMWNNRNLNFNQYFLQANPNVTYRIVKL